MRISEQQFQAACEVASRVYGGDLTSRKGAELLADNYGLNITSAGDFIYDYKQMMQGKLFQRAMSAPAMEYFLSEIQRVHGDGALNNAIESVSLHIEYFENHYDTNMHKMRAVVEAAKTKLSDGLSLSRHLLNFEASIDQSKSDSSAERFARLERAPKKPKRIRVYTEIFVRNPDVVVEVLIRANGKCETCGGKAPFNRKKDGTPYLEVHHKVKLADGGDDCVHNAIALCPNCHREQHFGENFA